MTPPSPHTADRPQPLAGFRIADLGQVILGPYATWMLASLGADVIKVEPLRGDMARTRSRGVWYHMLNRGKRSIAIDLSVEEGRHVFIDLLATSDVLVENYRPGVMERFGLGPNRLRERFPSLIHASARGFPDDSPDKDLRAVDLTVQALSGIMSATGDPDGPPMRAGVPLADFLAGAHLASAILVALLDRERNGPPASTTSVNMVECVVPMLAPIIGRFLDDPDGFVERVGNRNATLDNAPYDVYEANDGFVAIATQNNAHFEKLAASMGRPDIIGDLRFQSPADRAEHSHELDAIVSEWTRGLSKYAITDELAADVPVAPVRGMKEILGDGRTFLEMEHPEFGRIPAPRVPLRMSGAREESPVPAASELGADCEEILAEDVGYDSTTVQSLIDRRVVGFSRNDQ